MPPDPLFNPSSALADSILALVGSPDLSFHDIAARAETTPQALAAWLATPEIQERTASVHSAAASHIRLAATSNLHVSVASLVKLLHAFLADQPTVTSGANPADPRSTDPAVGNPADPTTDLKLRLARLREHETARRACYLLYRISRFDPLSPRAPGRVGRPPAADEVADPPWRAGEGSERGPTQAAQPSEPLSSPSRATGTQRLGEATSATPSTPAPHLSTTAQAEQHSAPQPSGLDLPISLESLTALLETFAAQAGIDTTMPESLEHPCEPGPHQPTQSPAAKPQPSTPNPSRPRAPSIPHPQEPANPAFSTFAPADHTLAATADSS